MTEPTYITLEQSLMLEIRRAATLFRMWSRVVAVTPENFALHLNKVKACTCFQLVFNNQF